MRTLREIAREIKNDWPAVNRPGNEFGYGHPAAPYLDAMSRLEKITDSYYQDSADSVVRYFLANATAWRGETARRVKAELKGMLK